MKILKVSHGTGFFNYESHHLMIENNLASVQPDTASKGTSSQTQYENFVNAKKGDLVFFAHGRRTSHVGIVQEITENGEVKFIHAATSKGVMISSLSDSYWAPKYRFAKRVLK